MWRRLGHFVQAKTGGTDKLVAADGAHGRKATMPAPAASATIGANLWERTGSG